VVILTSHIEKEKFSGAFFNEPSIKVSGD
jgi:hypothetical protein